ncbi:MAG: AMMECR1 domain-containing protein [Candidatus Gracilibacteria bacterium]|nr:AMMECR1 domain-containing protein [Candidatus Gracilibacteria bacterium]
MGQFFGIEKLDELAGNIKEIKNSIAEELIENTIEAIVGDSRFDKLSIGDSTSIKIRVDLITNRKVLARTDDEAKKGINTLAKIDPVKNGIIVIKKDYSNTTTILPNIDSKLITGKDYIGILSAKLGETFDENKYIIYEIETKIENDY